MLASSQPIPILPARPPFTIKINYPLFFIFLFIDLTIYFANAGNICNKYDL